MAWTLRSPAPMQDLFDLMALVADRDPDWQSRIERIIQELLKDPDELH